MIEIYTNSSGYRSTESDFSEEPLRTTYKKKNLNIDIPKDDNEQQYEQNPLMEVYEKSVVR